MSLLQQIPTIEQRYAGTVIRSGAAQKNEESSFIPTGWPAIDAALGGGLTMGALHEWFGMEKSDEATERRSDAESEPRPQGSGENKWRRHEDTQTQSIHAWTPALAPLVHLVRRAVGCVGLARRAVWIGRRCFPYGGVLIGPDGDRPAGPVINGHRPRLLERSIFVLAEQPGDRLWAIDLALRCQAVGVVVADGSGFDMAGTRRIQLAARAHGKPVLLIRPPWESRRLSAAQTRWLVRWEKGTEGWEEATKQRSDEATEALEGGSSVLNPRWSVELLRCKGMQPDSRPRTWALEWDRGEGALRLSAALAGAIGHAGATTGAHRRKQA